MNSHFTDKQLDALSYSAEYAEYIMANCGGERIICNSDTLLCAMEDGYLFWAFVESIQTTDCELTC